MNNMRTNLSYGGTTMYIHVIKRGESLWQIAQTYHSTVNQLLLVNDINDPKRLVVGQAIIVPEFEKEYVVEVGDTLERIAQNYGVRTIDLAIANGIDDPTMIFPGQLLKIPYVLYTVRPGDTLWKIAQHYQVTVEQIVAVNQIPNPDLIFPDQVFIIPFLNRPMIETNAYIRRQDLVGQFDVLRLGRHLTYLSPFMYRILEDGDIVSINDAGLVTVANAMNIKPLLTLTNLDRFEEFNSDLVASVLRQEAVQNILIENLLATIKAKGYQGVNIDFEYIYPEDRENYNQFLRRLVARFRPEGLVVATALAPKISADQEGVLYEAHDYETQARIVDFVILMTYEWGWAGGRPLAIAPIHRIREVLDYAVTVIPPHKLMMSIPLYGRDWNIPWIPGTLAKTVRIPEAIELAARYGATINYDDMAQAPYFTYVDEQGQEHEVWFEDARSLQAKYDLVKEYGLKGVSFWTLDMPFPQNWALLQQFVVNKSP